MIIHVWVHAQCKVCTLVPHYDYHKIGLRFVVVVSIFTFFYFSISLYSFCILYKYLNSFFYFFFFIWKLQRYTFVLYIYLLSLLIQSLTLSATFVYKYSKKILLYQAQKKKNINKKHINWLCSSGFRWRFTQKKEAQK